MKRRSSHLGEFLPPVKLYLDDVTSICDALREVCNRIALQTTEYECSEPSELATLPTQQLRDLSISGFDPYVNVDIKSKSVWLYTEADDIRSRGVFQKVKELLLRRRRRVARWFIRGTGLVLVIAADAITAPLMIGLYQVPRSQSVLYWVSLAVPVPAFVISATLLWFNFRGTNWVIVALRQQAPNFWRRNRDQIAVGAISAILGAVLGAIALYVISHR